MKKLIVLLLCALFVGAGCSKEEKKCESSRRKRRIARTYRSGGACHSSIIVESMNYPHITNYGLCGFSM